MTSGEQTHAPWQQVPERARHLFGERASLAAQYVHLLCTLGIERGLFGPREPARVWERHVLPGAALGELVPLGARVADLGSGAGLPGIPLALARPDLEMTLVEPMQRRVAFLQEVVGLLGMDVTVTRSRGEDAAGADADVVVARAVAPLARLLPSALPLLGEDGGALLAVKGQAAGDEITSAGAVLRTLAATAEIRYVGDGTDRTTVVTVAVPAKRLRSQARRSRSGRERDGGAR